MFGLCSSLKERRWWRWGKVLRLGFWFVGDSGGGGGTPVTSAVVEGWGRQEIDSERRGGERAVGEAGGGRAIGGGIARKRGGEEPKNGRAISGGMVRKMMNGVVSSLYDMTGHVVSSLYDTTGHAIGGRVITLSYDRLRDRRWCHRSIILPVACVDDQIWQFWKN
jgi:hypothetical protein